MQTNVITNTLVVKKNQRLDLIKFVADLSSLGYRRVYDSPEANEFSVRGGLVTIWPVRYREPVRIEFFGDRADTLSLIDPKTKAREEPLDEVVIVAVGAIQKIKRQKQTEDQIFLSEIRKGDYVVHIDHGVGRFLGYQEEDKHQTLLIEYAKGSRLYVPISQIDRLTKYIGPANKRPSLNYLGTGAWEKTKRRVHKSVVSMAKDLLRLYAQREQAQRPPYSPDSVWQRELEDSFEFNATEDQLQATADLKKDLTRQQPMDRLLVGDVGFGKTEVAIRVAFQAVQEGKQVAVLVPTTILAEQHYRVFLERMKRFPVRIEYLSRFVTSTKTRVSLEKLNNGEIDILIGTHRLLGQDVQFKNLGLLIIDEEHRFGVAQKEQTKKLKLEVDVLTLSATPIPRTLNAALSKLRDISTLSSPPEGRQQIVTNVSRYEHYLVRKAILDEIHRFGQVYYLFNKVQTIYQKAAELKKLIPEARFGVVHGQLPGEEIEKAMADFLERKFDVLVCTTIIASGLDIPNANTILVENAHLIGLADLHQLRGRVGRSDKQAYAYFFYPVIASPTPEALDRLLAIYEFQSLGAGFDIAKRDLEIRGAGNLLGREQSGQMSLVGYELYVQLLSQAVEKLRIKK